MDQRDGLSFPGVAHDTASALGRKPVNRHTTSYERQSDLSALRVRRNSHQLSFSRLNPFLEVPFPPASRAQTFRSGLSQVRPGERRHSCKEAEQVEVCFAHLPEVLQALDAQILVELGLNAEAVCFPFRKNPRNFVQPPGDVFVQCKRHGFPSPFTTAARFSIRIKANCPESIGP
jgi:hypothetical protein